MASKKKVVVTGMGTVTSLGLYVEESWQKALAGVSGISKLALPDTERSPVQAVGQVKEEDWDKIQNVFHEDALKEGERRTLFALWAARHALSDAGISGSNGERDRYGAVLSAGLGINRMEDIQRWIGRDKKFDFTRFGKEYNMSHKESIIRNNSSRPAALIAKKFGLNGMNSTITTACASATQAIGMAYRAIQRDDADLIVTGGADSMINPIGLVFFMLLKAAAISSEDCSGICRPFDRKRSGLVMGEGAATVVLEEESHALKRNARILAEVVGYGSTMDAYKVTAPHPKGVGATRSMQSALSDANLNPEDIDYINAHGTSTKLNDTAETIAIKNVFKESAGKVSISSSKSMIGHLIAASGGPEFVFTVLSVSRDNIHPTINLTNPDSKCGLDYVPNVNKPRRVRAALSNSFGFGGQNATVVVKKYCRENRWN